MAVNNALVQSGKNLYDAQNEQADISGSYKEGQKLITDQLDANKKQKQDDEDREYNQRKMERDEELAVADLDSKLTSYAAEKGEYLSLIDQGIDQGILKGPAYDDYLQDRDKWWKDKTNQFKILGDLGNKAAFKKRIGNAMAAEDNWGNMIQGAGGVAISDSSPDAQKKNLSITAWGKANGDVPPPITSRNGKDFFVIPNVDINGDGKIDKSDLDGNYDENQVTMLAVDQISVDQTGQGIYGDFNERVAIQGLQKSIGDDVELKGALKGGYASEDEIRQWFDVHTEDQIQIKEVADSLFNEGFDFDPKAYGIEDANGDDKIDGADFDANNDGAIDASERRIMQEVFQGVVEATYGKQGGVRPLSLDERKKISDIEYKKSQTFKNYQTEKGPKDNTEKDSKIALGSYNRYVKSNNIGELKGIGNIEEIKKNKAGQYILYPVDGESVVLGDKLDANSQAIIKNYLGIPGAEADDVQGPDDIGNTVQNYLNNFNNRNTNT